MHAKSNLRHYPWEPAPEIGSDPDPPVSQRPPGAGLMAHGYMLGWAGLVSFGKKIKNWEWDKGKSP